MPSTRRSARLASSQASSSPAKQESPQAIAGSKRKSDPGSSPTPKRGKKNDPKNQTTIEESMKVDPQGEHASRDESEPGKSQMKTDQTATNDERVSLEVDKVPAAENEDASKQQSQRHTQVPKSPATDSGQEQSSIQPQDRSEDAKTGSQAEDAGKSAPAQPDTTSGKQNDSHKDEKSEVKAQKDDDGDTPKQHSTTAAGGTDGAADTQPNGQAKEEPKTNGSAIESHARDSETPSSIMEKGLIYFFFRGRVGIENPSNVQDVARSHIVLRPLPHGAKLVDGPIGPSNNKCRLLALPKKVLPTSGKDRFMTFVEKAHTSFPELKQSFFPADEYETQTAGVRRTPPITPIAEGVYALTTTGRENHLAYMLTIPTDLGDVQKDIGLRDQGSFVVSCKNPQFPGPSYASLPKSPEYPKEILEEFRSLRWMPLQPKHLDYENAQFLLIGESGGLDKATDVPEDKQEPEQDTPKQEIERLEGEDEIRIKHLKGDDAIFTDLGVSKKDYSSIPSTWND